MTLPNHINDREYNKFNQTGLGLVSVRVSDDNESLNQGGVMTAITLNSSTWTALPTSPYANRKTISIQNQSSGQIKINYNNSESGYVGMSIAKDGERVYNLTSQVMLYGKCAAGTASVIVEEVG